MNHSKDGFIFFLWLLFFLNQILLSQSGRFCGGKSCRHNYCVLKEKNTTICPSTIYPKCLHKLEEGSSGVATPDYSPQYICCKKEYCDNFPKCGRTYCHPATKFCVRELGGPTRCPEDKDEKSLHSEGCNQLLETEHKLIAKNVWCCRMDECPERVLKCGDETCDAKYCIAMESGDTVCGEKNSQELGLSEGQTIVSEVAMGPKQYYCWPRIYEEGDGNCTLKNYCSCPNIHKVRICGADRGCVNENCVVEKTWDFNKLTTRCPTQNDTGCYNATLLYEEIRLTSDSWCCNKDGSCDGKAKFCGNIPSCQKPYCIRTGGGSINVPYKTICPSDEHDQKCDTELEEGAERRLSRTSWCCKKDGECEGLAKMCGSEFCNKTYCVYTKKNGNEHSQCPESNEFDSKCQHLSEGDERRLSNDKWCCRKDGTCTATVRMCGDNHSCNKTYCIMQRIFDKNQRLINNITCPKDNILDDVCLNMDVGEESAFNSTGNPKKWCCNMNKECQATVRKCGSERKCSADFCIGELTKGGKIRTRCPTNDEKQDLLNQTRGLGEEGEVWLSNEKWACNRTECKGNVIKCGDNNRCKKTYCIAKNVDNIPTTRCPEPDVNGLYSHDDDCNFITNELRLNADEWCCNGLHSSRIGHCPCKAKFCGNSKCEETYCILNRTNGNNKTVCPHDETYKETCKNVVEGGEKRLGPYTWCCKKDKQCDGKAKLCGTNDYCNKPYCVSTGTEGMGNIISTCPASNHDDKRCDGGLSENGEKRLNDTTWCCKMDNTCPAETRICGTDDLCNSTYCLMTRGIKKTNNGTVLQDSTTCPNDDTKVETDPKCLGMAIGQERKIESSEWCCRVNGICTGKTRVCGKNRSCNHPYCIGETGANGTVATRCPDPIRDQECLTETLTEGEEVIIKSGVWCCHIDNCPGTVTKCGDDNRCDHTYCLSRLDGQIGGNNSLTSPETFCPSDNVYDQQCGSFPSGAVEIRLNQTLWCCDASQNLTNRACPNLAKHCDNSSPCHKEYCLDTEQKGRHTVSCPHNTTHDDKCMALEDGEELRLSINEWCCKKDHECDRKAKMCGDAPFCKKQYCIFVGEEERYDNQTKCPDSDEYDEKCTTKLTGSTDRRLTNNTWCCKKDGHCRPEVRICGTDYSCNSTYCITTKDGFSKEKRVTTCPTKVMTGNHSSFCMGMTPGQERRLNSTAWCCRLSERSCSALLRICGSDRSCQQHYCFGQLNGNGTMQTICPRKHDHPQCFGNSINLKEDEEEWLQENQWCCNKNDCDGHVIKCGYDARCNKTYCISTRTNETENTKCPTDGKFDDTCESFPTKSLEKRLDENRWCCKGPVQGCPNEAEYCGEKIGCHSTYCVRSKNTGETECPSIDHWNEHDECRNLTENGEVRITSDMWCCKTGSYCNGEAKFCGASGGCTKSYCIQTKHDESNTCPANEKYDKVCESLPETEEKRLTDDTWCCKKDEQCPAQARICGNNTSCDRDYCIMVKVNGASHTTCPNINKAVDAICSKMNPDTEKRINTTAWCCNNNANCPGKTRICGSDRSCVQEYCLAELINTVVKTRCPKPNEIQEDCKELSENEEKIAGKYRHCCKKEHCDGTKHKCGNDENCEHPYCWSENVNGKPRTTCPTEDRIHFDCLQSVSYLFEFEHQYTENQWCCRNHTGECPRHTITCGNDCNCKKPFCIARGKYSRARTTCPDDREVKKYRSDCDINLSKKQEKWLENGTWCCKMPLCYGVAGRCGDATDGSERCKYHFCVRDEGSDITRCPTDLEGIGECRKLPKYANAAAGNMMHIKKKKIYCCSMTNKCQVPGSKASQHSVADYYFFMFLLLFTFVPFISIGP